jgi:hypothetical protein
MDYLRQQPDDAAIVKDIMTFAEAGDDFARRVAAYYHYGRMVVRRVAAGEQMLAIQQECGVSPNQHSYGCLIARFEVEELEATLKGENPPTIKKLAAMKRTAQKNPNPVGRRHKRPSDTPANSVTSDTSVEAPTGAAQTASVTPAIFVAPVEPVAPTAPVEPAEPLSFTEGELALIRSAVREQYDRAEENLIHETAKRRGQKQHFINIAKSEMQELEPLMRKLGIQIDSDEDAPATPEKTETEEEKKKRQNEEVERELAEYARGVRR